MKNTMKSVLAASTAIVVAFSVSSTAFADNDKRGGKRGGKGVAHIFLQNADVNNDKAITFDEVSQNINGFFTSADTNADALLSKDELEAGLKAKMEERKAARDAKRAEDGEQSASNKRMKRGEKRAEDRLAKGVDRLMQRVDTNGDGSIAKTEIDDRAKITFAYLDLNADGKLEGDELKKRGGKHGKKRGGKHHKG
ncbi:MAG: hypothetical protein AB8B49_05685 [Nitratireductor sp.]